MDIPWSGKAIAYQQGDFIVALVAREDIKRAAQEGESEMDAVARCILGFLADWWSYHEEIDLDNERFLHFSTKKYHVPTA